MQSEPVFASAPSQEKQVSANPRGIYHSAVITDPGVSAGAVRLYDILDDHARQRGFCWLKMKTLMLHMGCSRRSIQYYLAELVQAEHVQVQWMDHRTFYYLAWNPGAQRVAHSEVGSAQPIAQEVRSGLRTPDDLSLMNPIQKQKTPVVAFKTRAQSESLKALLGPGYKTSAEREKLRKIYNGERW